MANLKQKTITTTLALDPRSATALAKFAKRKKLDLNQAADRLIKVAIGRLGALDKYNSKAA